MDISLQPFELVDIPRLLKWIPDEEFLMLWSGPYFTWPLTEEQLAAHYQSGQQDPPIRKIYKAVTLPGNEVVGNIELNNIDFRNRAATVSKVLIGNPALRGHGYGGQMVKELCRIAFDEFKLHRLQIYVFEFNHAAIHTYMKLGFKQEGKLRDYRRVGSAYWSSILMSLLEEEYRFKLSAG